MPSFITEKCISCGKCSKDCPADAIDLPKFEIDSHCIECGHCVAICPVQAMEIENQEPVALHTSELSFLDFQRLIKQTRTVRQYKDQVVEQEKLNSLMDMLKSAPSASNGRKVEITVFTKKEDIQLINNQTSDILHNLFSKLTSPFLYPIIRLLKGSSTAASLKSYSKKMAKSRQEKPNFICYEAPVVILFSAPKASSSMSDVDASIWMTYVTLAAKPLGLGSCMNGFIKVALERNKKFFKRLNLNPNHEVFTALLLGYPDVKYINEVGRDAPKVTYR